MGEFDLGKSVKEQTGTGTLTSGNVFLFPKISLLILPVGVGGTGTKTSALQFVTVSLVVGGTDVPV